MKSPTTSPAARLRPGAPLTLASVPEGAEGLVVADLARACAAAQRGPIALAMVCRDGRRMQALADALGFFAPEIATLQLPAWDCLPYDRVSPHAAVVSRRMTTLSRLSRMTGSEQATILLTTVNALLQRVPPREALRAQALSVAAGQMLSMDGIVEWLSHNGFTRTATVREPGEFAVRGGIVDMFAATMDAPVRFDFFGDTLESIRVFDAESQRTLRDMRALDLVPATEYTLTTDTIRRFRTGYIAAFGAADRDDALYQAVSEGRRHPGIEHWLPLFYPALETVFDYLPDVPFLLEAQAEDSAQERIAQIADYYEARREAAAHHTGPAYRPLPPATLYLDAADLAAAWQQHPLARLSPFALPEGAGWDAALRAGHNFAAERADPAANVFEALARHVDALQAAGKRVAIALWSDGSRERMSHVLAEHRLTKVQIVGSWQALQGLAPKELGLAVLGIESGFESDQVAIISEQDILGDRLVRGRRASRKVENFIAEVNALSTGDLVVHVDHGIGRFVGLKAIEAAGAPHDCLEIHYAGGDKLFLPVENIELLSRYGSEQTGVELDRLGGTAWQSRKAKLKNRIRQMASELIKIAAERAMHQGVKLPVEQGPYDEFCAGFPYEETEDQQNAIDAVLADLSSGKPMDRLVCGDVGFGKTEVALRAAFAAAMNGKQVALIAPTTLLARQHARTFAQRFKGFPVRVAQASRLVSAPDLAKTKKGIADGSVDIVVGTHVLLGKTIAFKNLGLVIVDEEQHFGVAHKERLKKLRAEVHVLTLTATPIPRTLQMALTGVRDLSIIASPPVDRLAVRTFVSPFDPLMVREALLRERYRGGQAFYVCPRIEDLALQKEFLDRHVPEMRVAVAHGQMTPGVIEDIMTAFYDGKYDVLLSTTIVESGLDIPSANTLIVHRADMFGLAQLYQLRGRVGRSKLRAYALLTLPEEKRITGQAERRLSVLQSLDSLGAGFQLASHDLDIRGAGNLLGDEQSGHIKEVGFELYQQMLEEAVASLKAGSAAPADDKWSPQITIGTPVLIPESYVADLSLRLALYRRLADIEEPAEIESVAAEMVDRFGPVPEEVEHLFAIVAIKTLCLRAHIAKVDAGPKGLVLSFRDDSFADPEGLVRYIRDLGAAARVRPDMKVVFFEDWETPEDRLKGAARILKDLAAIAAAAPPQPAKAPPPEPVTPRKEARPARH